jgi:hypothetical protein
MNDDSLARQLAAIERVRATCHRDQVAAEMSAAGDNVVSLIAWRAARKRAGDNRSPRILPGPMPKPLGDLKAP